jgi:hypothetical protein
MYDYLYYIIFIVILLGTFLYFRIKYGFWISQPVFHCYDIFYMLFPRGIINTELPKINKYTNLINVTTIIYSEISDLKMTQFTNFIKLNYLRNGDNIYVPKKENIISYFKGHQFPSFFSFYTEDYLIQDLTNNTTITEDKIIGLMTSRPLRVTINNLNKKQNIQNTFYVYYADYLCVDTNHRKKGIAPQIIQTHEYNQRHKNTKICVSLFKREDELTGIMPLCVYKTYGFSVIKWRKPVELSAVYSMIEICKQNMYLLVEFINENKKRFDIVIMPEVSNLLELINTKNMFIYVILFKDKICSAYFFKKSNTFIEKDLEVLTCIASINNGVLDNSVFIHGFKINFWNISEKYNFGFSAIENIADNNDIIQNIILKTPPKIISPCAYFFYNFAYPTFNADKAFILN